MFWPLLRSILFRMEAEDSHRFALGAIDLLGRTGAGRLLLRSNSTYVDPEQPRLFGKPVRNRIGLAAGLDKHGSAVQGFSALGFGFVECGTVTPRPQPGNPKPRLFRLPEHQAIINRMGFNSVGTEQFLLNIGTRPREVPLGINIGKNADTPVEEALNDYARGLEAVHQHADYVTINISSPNTPGLRDIQAEALLYRFLQDISVHRERLADQYGVRTPVVVKIAPDLSEDDVKRIGQQLITCRFDGAIATNTTVNRSTIAGHRLAGEAGGLSGRPLDEASTNVLSHLRAVAGDEFTLIGSGGVMSADDAKEKMLAGASFVQLYTGLIYAGPALIRAAANAVARS